MTNFSHSSSLWVLSQITQEGGGLYLEGAGSVGRHSADVFIEDMLGFFLVEDFKSRLLRLVIGSHARSASVSMNLQNT